MNKATIIKEAVDIRRAAEYYGVHFNNRGQATCPFHEDHHPSASIKNGRLHCYVCDLHLDIIAFVQILFQCNFKDALSRINEDFRCGLDLQKPLPSAELNRLLADKRQKEQELLKYRAEYDAKTAEYRRIWNCPRPSRGDPEAGEYAPLLGRREYLEYWFSENHWR